MPSSLNAWVKWWSIFERVVVDNTYRSIIGSLHYSQEYVTVIVVVYCRVA